MWKWRVVLEMLSKSEKITIVGESYPTEKIAQWVMGEWLRKLLPNFFLFKILDTEVYCERGVDK